MLRKNRELRLRNKDSNAVRLEIVRHMTEVLVTEDKVDRADLDHHPLQYLYRSGGEFTFMNTESYEMVNLTADNLGDAINYLVENMTFEMSFFEGKPVGVDLPMFVELAEAAQFGARFKKLRQ